MEFHNSQVEALIREHRADLMREVEMERLAAIAMQNPGKGKKFAGSALVQVGKQLSRWGSKLQAAGANLKMQPASRLTTGEKSI